MRFIAILVCLNFLLLTSCSSEQPAQTTPVAATETPEATPELAQAELDLSTPEAAVTTFIKAGQGKNARVLAACFTEGAPGEFARLRDGSASDQELAELAEFVDGAMVGEASMNEAGTQAVVAVVAVTFKTRDEQITVKKTDAGWVILDF